MKKTKMFLVGLITCVFSINYVSAATVTANSFNDLNNGKISINSVSSNNTGYVISDKFVCYGCESEEDTEYEGTSKTTSGIGIYFKNNNNWETGSFAGSASNAPFPDYAMSSFFVAMTTGNKDYSDAISNGLLTASGNTLAKTYSNATVNVTAETPENKNYVKLIYNVKSNVDQTVKIATFNDIYLGSPISTTDRNEACKDNASYEKNTHIKNITNGFNAKTSGKFMSVILEENTNLLNNGGGTFNYWVGSYAQEDDSLPSTVVVNMFGSSALDSKPYDDSAFSYSWSKEMKAGEETTFSTLIGLGNLGNVSIDIDEESGIKPNYDKDNKQFTLTENDSNINISGIIKDECGMGTCTYTINGSEPIPCDEEVYYTSGENFTSNFTTTIGIKEHLKSGSNTFKVTANSVACGTSTDELTFNIPGEKNPQTGINNNYIVLGLILIGGIGVFVYSRKHNKFPQV